MNKRYSEVIADAVHEAIGVCDEPPEDMESKEWHWFAMYQAQCVATDQFGKLANKKAPSELTARIKELERDLATVNRRLSQSGIERNAEEIKLIAFFNTAEGDDLGRGGDYDNLTPAETAIRAMKKLIKETAS